MTEVAAALRTVRAGRTRSSIPGRPHEPDGGYGWKDILGAVPPQARIHVTVGGSNTLAGRRR